MEAEQRRWRRSALVSASLHAALFGLMLWLAGPGEDSVSLVLGELPFAAEPRFEAPAALPIELAQLPSLDPQRVAARAEPSLAQPRERVEARGEPAVSARSERQPRASEHEPEHAEHAEPSPERALPPDEGPQPGESGLAGAGEAKREGPLPSLLGSREALAEATQHPNEGPARPEPAQRPGDYAFEREGQRWVYRHPGGSVTATLQDDGGVVFRNHLIRVRPELSPSIANNGEAFMTVVIEYDPVGIARAAAGHDPYPRAKGLLLAATFEERLELARRYHKRKMIFALAEFDGDLARIWARKSQPAAERKRLLFERWDACVEADLGESGFRSEEAREALDGLQEALAHAARRKVIRFVNEVAPAGSAEAYTTSELAALNAKRVSREPFAPYE